MNNIFLMGTTSFITVQSLGKIALRMPAVDAKTWCLYVLFVCNFVIMSRTKAGVLVVRG